MYNKCRNSNFLPSFVHTITTSFPSVHAYILPLLFSYFLSRRWRKPTYLSKCKWYTARITFFVGHTWFGSRSSIYQISLDEKSSDCASTNYRQKQTVSKGESHLNNQIYKFSNHFLLVKKLSEVTTWKLNWLLNWITVNDFHFLSVLLLSSYCFDYVYIRSFKYQLVYKYFLIWKCTGGVLWERQHSWQWNLGRYGFERILRANWYIN